MAYYISLPVDKPGHLVATTNVLAAIEDEYDLMVQGVSTNLEKAYPFILWFQSKRQDSEPINRTATRACRAMTGSHSDTAISGTVAITGHYLPDADILTAVEGNAVRVLMERFGMKIDFSHIEAAESPSILML